MTDVATSPGRVRFRLSGPVAATVTVPRAGLHIARNAAGVVALLAELGHDPEAAAEGIAGYRGVRRRFERRGTVNGTTVVDDYAHHPTEVQATLAEAGAIAAGRLIAVFQPHLYSRTARFAADFGQALATADLVVVTDVYGSREDPVPGVNGVLVASEAAAAGAAEVVYVPHLADLAATVADAAHPGDVVVTMGAGDITTVVPDLLAELEARA
jgi:UDP-N-acetylmuramate--alanine ligase